jgi:ornithine decarboxylase
MNKTSCVFSSDAVNSNDFDAISLISTLLDECCLVAGDDPGFLTVPSGETTIVLKSNSDDEAKFADYRSLILSKLSHFGVKDTAFAGLLTTLTTEVELQQTEENNDASSFYLVDLGTLTRKYLLFCKFLPRVKPFYAIKCNPDPMVARTLALLGAGFDCASHAEMAQCVPLVSSSAADIIFANPCKMPAHIRDAKRLGVKMMTFDNATELHKIQQIYPDAECVLRLAPPTSLAKISFTSKFGASEKSAQQLLCYAQALGLDVIGVSFHVGSGCEDPTAYVNAIQLARRVFDFAHDALGIKMRLLDIGGGFPGTDAFPDQFADMGNTISRCLDQLFPESDFDNIRVIAEPGRFFATEIFTLAVPVIAKRDTNDFAIAEDTIDSRCFDDNSSLSGDDGESISSSLPKNEVLYYLADGIYGSFNNIFFDHVGAVEPRTLVMQKPSTILRSCTLFGPTCDSVDVIGKGISLPDLSIGDYLYFSNMGAYTVAASSTFNGFPPPRCRYIFGSV